MKQSTDSPSTLRRSLRLCLIEGIVAMPICYLAFPGNFALPGNFILAALLTGCFHLPESTYGWIISLPFWCNGLQLVFMPLLARRYSAKTIAATGSLLQLLAWVGLWIALPWLPRDPHAFTAAFFFVFFLVSSQLGAFCSVAWSAWVREWVPERIRGQYFGLRYRLLQLSLVVFFLGVAAVMGGRGDTLRAFQIVVGFAVLTRAASVALLFRTPAGRSASMESQRVPWREQLGHVWRARPLWWFMLFGAGWGLAANTFGPFYPVFMYRQLGLSAAQVSLLVILNTLASAIAFPAWGRLLDRFGNKPVMAAALLLWQLPYYLWCVLTPANAWLLYPFWLWSGFISAGFILGQFNLLLKLLPAEAQSTAIGCNLAITALVAAIAPIIGGELISWATAAGYAADLVYRYAFIVQPTLALLACLLLLRVHEPQASPLASVLHAMRHVRTLGTILGLTQVLNLVTVRPPKTPSP